MFSRRPPLIRLPSIAFFVIFLNSPTCRAALIAALLVFRFGSLSMLVIPGGVSTDTCDGVTRRELLRVGGTSLLGLNLAGLFANQSRAADVPASSTSSGGRGFGKAKSVILVYLQGGPSHLDLWDPKENVPANVKSVFKNIPTKIPGVHYTEILPKLAQVNDKFSMIRSMSYTPNGLFNHTAAIYQIHTGYTTDKVSASGQLEPPSPKDFPTLGSNIIKMKPVTVPMLPFVMMPRPLQESNVVGKGGAAGFLGKAYDPYLLYPPGDDMDMTKMDRISVADLQLREDLTPERMSRRATLRETIAKGMPEIEQAVGAIQAVNDAEAQGLGAATYKGMMIDAATARLFQVTVDRARHYGLLRPRTTATGYRRTLGEAPGPS